MSLQELIGRAPDIQCNVITAYLAIFRRGLYSMLRQGCRYSSGSADRESAALPFAQYGALALMPLAHAFRRCVSQPRRRAAPHEALGRVRLWQHDCIYTQHDYDFGGRKG